MKWDSEYTPEFLLMLKKLAKKYRSIGQDVDNFSEALESNPFQGALLTPGIRKIRMAISSKGRGKSAGARIITLTYYVSADDGKIVFLLIYDHDQADTVDVNAVKAMAKAAGYDLDALQAGGQLK